MNSDLVLCKELKQCDLIDSDTVAAFLGSQENPKSEPRLEKSIPGRRRKQEVESSQCSHDLGELQAQKESLFG